MTDEIPAEKPQLITGPNPVLSEQTLYFNGFAVTVTPADVIITVQMQGQSILSLHASHVVAKTLLVKLASVIQAMEARTGQSFKTTDEMLVAIQKAGSDAQPDSQ